MKVDPRKGPRRQKLHAMRPSHGKHMLRAKDYANKAFYHWSMKGEQVEGFKALWDMIGELQGCGCDESLWPERVREAIKRGESE